MIKIFYFNLMRKALLKQISTQNITLLSIIPKNYSVDKSNQWNYYHIPNFNEWFWKFTF